MMMMTMNSYFDVTRLRARLRGARLCAFILRGKPLVDPSVCRQFFGPVLSLITWGWLFYALATSLAA